MAQAECLCPPPNPYVEIQTPNVMVMVLGEALGKYLGHEGR